MPDSKVHQIVRKKQVEEQAEEYAMHQRRHTNLQLPGTIMDDFLKKERFSAQPTGTRSKKRSHIAGGNCFIRLPIA